jgi:hypothetical protein
MLEETKNEVTLTSEPTPLGLGSFFRKNKLQGGKMKIFESGFEYVGHIHTHR